MTDWRVLEEGGECCCRARATAAKVALLLLLLLVVNQVKELVSLKLKRRVNGWLGWVGLGLGHVAHYIYPVQCKLNSPLAFKNGGHALLLKKKWWWKKNELDSCLRGLLIIWLCIFSFFSPAPQSTFFTSYIHRTILCCGVRFRCSARARKLKGSNADESGGICWSLDSSRAISVVVDDDDDDVWRFCVGWERDTRDAQQEIRRWRE